MPKLPLGMGFPPAASDLAISLWSFRVVVSVGSSVRSREGRVGGRGGGAGFRRGGGRVVQLL